MRVALIDGDTLVYEGTTASEKAINWGDGLWTLHGFENEANDHFDSLVTEIKEATEADDVIIALSSVGDVRWREGIMPTYKAHRKEKRKPLLFPTIREYCEKNYKTLVRPKLEGDDILGILATHPNLKMLEGVTSRVCVSIDKDLKTIPGEHYNYQKRQAFTVTEDEADYHHLTQAITGDTTDGYPGCPGVGPVSAAKLLDPYRTVDCDCWKDSNGTMKCHCGEPKPFDVAGAWKAIVAQYAKKKLSEEVALLNARVARICRHTDYDMNKREVILWNPPKA